MRARRHLSVLKDTPTKHSYKSASNPPVQPLSTLVPAKKTLPLTFGFDLASCKINGFISVIIEGIYLGQLDCSITKYSEEPMKSLLSFLPSLIFIKSS